MTSPSVYTSDDIQDALWREDDIDLHTRLRLDRDSYARLMIANPADPYIEVIRERIEAEAHELQRRRSLADRFKDDMYGPRFEDTSTARYEAARQLTDRVRDLWPIDRFLTELFGSRLVSKGSGRWVTHCILPGHDDRNPSMHVYGAEGRAWCFVCNAGGSVFDLVMSTSGLDTFREAVLHLARASGIGPENDSPRPLAYKGLGNREQFMVKHRSGPVRPIKIVDGRVSS